MSRFTVRVIRDLNLSCLSPTEIIHVPDSVANDNRRYELSKHNNHEEAKQILSAQQVRIASPICNSNAVGQWNHGDNGEACNESRIHNIDTGFDKKNNSLHDEDG